jgi:hypothetical protein
MKSTASLPTSKQPGGGQSAHRGVGAGPESASSDVTKKARTGFAQGLHWLSEELGNLATKFTPVEKLRKMLRSPETA